MLSIRSRFSFANPSLFTAVFVFQFHSVILPSSFSLLSLNLPLCMYNLSVISFHNVNGILFLLRSFLFFFFLLIFNIITMHDNC